jgi:hypothetical protein
MKALILLFIACAAYGVHPENQIIVVENFISTDVAKALIQYYDAEKRNLNNGSDNEFSLSSMDNPHIKKIIRDISEQVIQLMHRSYPLMGKNHQLDHAGLYARIVSNYCPYHADNVYFECPTHGRNQQQLRTICSGNCPGAKFVPNHTPWREYTALIYLNDEFEGGEIAFEDGPQNRQYKKTIPIHANLLVLAPNGSDFYHEVFPIRKGKRYSLHLWITSDSRHWLPN